VRYPLDEQDAEVLLVTPSADFFAEPQVDGLIGYGKVFHQAGIPWTISSHASEAANFGLFTGSYENMRRVALRIREAALELGVKWIPSRDPSTSSIRATRCPSTSSRSPTISSSAAR
jgi:hypothetical protein